MAALMSPNAAPVTVRRPRLIEDYVVGHRILLLCLTEPPYAVQGTRLRHTIRGSGRRLVRKNTGCAIHPQRSDEGYHMSQSENRSVTQDENSGFVRTLGTVDALFIWFGAMIGFGWVVLTGEWLTGAGTLGAILAFVVGGIIMCFVGTVYSEMVAAMPHAGGEHNYLIRAMGPRISLFGSWAITGGYISVVMFEAVAVPKTAV